MKCDCGAEKAKTGHAHWCSTQQSQGAKSMTEILYGIPSQPRSLKDQEKFFKKYYDAKKTGKLFCGIGRGREDQTILLTICHPFDRDIVRNYVAKAYVKKILGVK